MSRHRDRDAGCRREFPAQFLGEEARKIETRQPIANSGFIDAHANERLTLVSFLSTCP